MRFPTGLTEESTFDMLPFQSYGLILNYLCFSRIPLFVIAQPIGATRTRHAGRPIWANTPGSRTVLPDRGFPNEGGGP